MLNSLLIAKIIINKCLEKNIYLNTPKLLKILYLIQIEYVIKYNKLIFTEDLVIDKLEPIIYSLNTYFKSEQYGFTQKNKTKLHTNNVHNEIINDILKKYGKYSSYELMNIIKKDPYYIDLLEKGYNNINEYLKTHISKNKELILKKND